MKIFCGPTILERLEMREERRRKWHLWFAWHPVRMTDDPSGCRWLETVQRKIEVTWNSCGSNLSVRVIKQYKPKEEKQ